MAKGAEVKRRAIAVVQSFLFALCLWIVIASLAWQFRNQRCNGASFWAYFSKAMQFEREPRCQ
jgi:hypothetical protein